MDFELVCNLLFHIVSWLWYGMLRYFQGSHSSQDGTQGRDHGEELILFSYHANFLEFLPDLSWTWIIFTLYVFY